MRTGAASTRQPKGRNDGTGRGEAGTDNPLDQAKLDRGETGIDPGDFGAQVGFRHHRAEVEAGRLMLGGLTDSCSDGVSLFGSQICGREAARDRMRVEHLFVYSIAAVGRFGRSTWKASRTERTGQIAARITGDREPM